MKLPMLGRTAPGRRRPPSRLGFEDLEGRLALAAPVMAPLPTQATVRPLAVPAPLALSASGVSIVINNVVRNAQTGATNFSGTISTSIFNQAVSLPFNGVITPPRNARGTPILVLTIPPTTQTAQGLTASTAGATLTLTPRRGAAGASVIAGLNSVIGQAGTVSNQTVTSTLNGLMNSPEVSGALSRTISSARLVVRSFSVATTANPATLGLNLNPVNVNVPAFNLRLNNGQNGPIRIDLAGTSTGGLLGSGLVGIVGEGQRRLVQNRFQTTLAYLIRYA